MSTLGEESRPLRVAIIGSGPSGFYAAESLLKSDIVIDIDMYDRLPIPFGLVRGGVAPDHPKIKSVIKLYEKTATHERFHFLGNVSIGKNLSVDELKTHYDAILFSCGAETDRRLGIPGEDLTGSYTATEFVGWYNGHPDYQDRTFDLSHEVAIIIGQGNVAMDVSRILSKTVDELRTTDMAQHALDALAESKIKEIHLIGRRGPIQAKFTKVEIAEFGELTDCDPVFNNPDDLTLNTASQVELDDAKNTLSQRNWKVFQEFLTRPPASQKSKKFIIHFFQSPIELIGNNKLEKILLEKNELTGEAFSQKAKGTGETQELSCGLLFRSVGYRGIAIPGVPFDDKRGIFPNLDGRITDNNQTVPGLYAAGWIKRGPSGVIGTNKPDSIATVQLILADAPTLAPCKNPSTDSVLDLLKSRDVRVVSFPDWKKIDQAEIENGQVKGKPREKFTSIAEMIAVLDGSPVS